MNAEAADKKEMNVLNRIIGIFSSPKEAFESIDQKPTWLVPFVIGLVVFLVFQFTTLDIQMKDQLASMEARGVPQEQVELAQNQMQGPLRYIGFIVGPVMMLVVWAVVAGIFLFAGNTLMGGEAKFKKVFSVVAWSNLVGSVGLIVRTLLVISKGTNFGVTTSLAILLPTPALGESPPMLYRLFSQFELFAIWQLVVQIIGLAIIYKFTTKKSATLVVSLWAIYVILAVLLGGVFSGMVGG